MSVDLSVWPSRIVEARDRIRGVVQETPVALIADDGRFNQAFLKLEHLQTTGSFKLRGAANKVFSLSPEEAARGVVTSSTGNHGLGVATSARHRGIDAEIFVSTRIPPEKPEAIEAAGGRIHYAGDDPLTAELAARAAAVTSGRTYISPYNDPLVVAGQGTVALEVVHQVDHISAIYVAVGGGGLIGGIGAYMKSASARTTIVGCWPENSRVMYECLRAGRIVKFPEQPTLSESTAGGVEPGSITFELCQQVIDRTVLVSESEILGAMRWAHQRGWRIEGAAGVALAAFFKSHQPGETAVVIACGGNLSRDVLDRL